MGRRPVNDDWNMGNLREYLGLRFELKGEYSFVINGNPLRKRKERAFLCKNIPFPRCIHIAQIALAM